MNTIEALVSEFTQKLTAAVQADLQSRIQAAMSGAFPSTTPIKRGRGRPPKASSSVAAASAAPVRRSQKPISAARAATMKRQGQYMAALRQYKGSTLIKIRAISKKDGVPAALAFIKTLPQN
jgi:hypothetical protein